MVEKVPGRNPGVTCEHRVTRRCALLSWISRPPILSAWRNGRDFPAIDALRTFRQWSGLRLATGCVIPSDDVVGEPPSLAGGVVRLSSLAARPLHPSLASPFRFPGDHFMHASPRVRAASSLAAFALLLIATPAAARQPD